MWALHSQCGPEEVKVLDFPFQGACVYMPEEIEMMFGTRIGRKDQDTLNETNESSGKLAYVMVSRPFTMTLYSQVASNHPVASKSSKSQFHQKWYHQRDWSTSPPNGGTYLYSSQDLLQ